MSAKMKAVREIREKTDLSKAGKRV